MFLKKIAFVIFSFSMLLGDVLCKPVDVSDAGSDPLKICYDLSCPDGTVVCGKHAEVSQADKTKLDVQIRCYDEKGIILKSKNGTEENPFGPDVYYKGTRLSSVIKLTASDLSGSDGDDDFKESNAIPSIYNKPKTGPKSEVDDLNGGR